MEPTGSCADGGFIVSVKDKEEEMNRSPEVIANASYYLETTYSRNFIAVSLSAYKYAHVWP
jgi:hypothetical protein